MTLKFWLWDRWGEFPTCGTCGSQNYTLLEGFQMVCGNCRVIIMMSVPHMLTDLGIDMPALQTQYDELLQKPLEPWVFFQAPPKE